VKTKDLEKNGKLLLEQLYKAAKGTVAEEVTLKYPKRARTTIHREGWGEKLDAWSKRINGACRQIKRLEKRPRSIKQSPRESKMEMGRDTRRVNSRQARGSGTSMEGRKGRS